MKSLVRILALILAISSIVSVMSSCKKDDENQPQNEPAVTYEDYTVLVLDDYGNPVRDVMVRFINEKGEVKSRLTFEDGIASYKNAVAGKYIVVLEKGSSVAILDQTEYQVSPSNNMITVVVRNEKKTTNIYGDAVGEDDGYAHIVTEGQHKFTSKAGTTAYFVFTANLPGKYRVSFVSRDSGMTVGYYGNPMFVQTTHRGDGEYDGKSFEIEIRDVSAPYVIGLNYTIDTDATLVIERVGDTTFDPNFDVPVVLVDSSLDNLVQFNLLAGTEVVDFDITNSELSVELHDDGFYYTSDGNLLYLRITSVGNHSNMSLPLPSIKDMLALGTDPDAMGTTGGINFGGFVYDENGNYVEKRIYNDMLNSYYEVCDGKYGLYPLTAELAEAIKVHGDNSGWWDMDNEFTCVFNDDVYEPNAWLFFCCTLVYTGEN